MPTIGRLTVSVYREESPQTDELIEAFCFAQAAFLPVMLDKTGYRNGQSYRYASIASIRRSTQAALAMHGLICHHLYGQGEGGEYVVTVLRHKGGQFISSTLRIPERVDPQEAKALRTLLCRTAIEGILGIVTEEDDDGASAGTGHSVSEEQLALWSATWAAASSKIASAKTVAEVDRYESIAIERMEQGSLSPDMKPEIERVCNQKRDQLKEMKTNDDRAGTAVVEESNAAGSGDGKPHRRNGRGAA